MEENKSKIKLASLVLLIFSSIFGFNNSINAYYQMGYYSIIWYLVSALLFFLPSAMIFAEYGSTFKGAKGGIYSWLKGSVSNLRRHLYLAGRLGHLAGIFNPVLLRVCVDFDFWPRHYDQLASRGAIINPDLGDHGNCLYGHRHLLCS